MSSRQTSREIAGNAPSSATSASVGEADGLQDTPVLGVTAKIAGNTGGVLDVYIQRWDVALGEWIDWAHFPQISAGAAAARYFIAAPAQAVTIQTVGADSSPSIAANSCVGGHPGNKVRVWAVSGASTTAGGAIEVSFQGLR